MRARSWLAALLIVACSAERETPAPRADTVRIDRSDLPLRAITPADLDRFRQGDALFDATMREADGLGPLFIRASCAACHRDDARGPGTVARMALLDADGMPLGDQSGLRYGPTQRPYATSGARALVAPDGARVRTSYRFPPAVFARGYLEAIADEEIERLEREAAARTNGIRGRIHRVAYQSETNVGTAFHHHARDARGLIGRFGLKARIATVDDFTADALQGDMGMTSPLRPREPLNPAGVLDDRKPGIDLSLDIVNLVADYVRLLELPARRNDTARGRTLFAELLCATCHVPALRTRDDYAIPALAGIAASVYTDLLLHDMGEALSDGVTDGDAGPREWRTAPLVGLRFSPRFMHDGRAASVDEAIAAHEGPGSEANESVRRFRALAVPARAELLRFVAGL